jgi:putative peptide zinc metalloprotease protein
MTVVGTRSTPRIRTRPDLIIQQQIHEGETHYIVKDPVGMRYYRLRPVDYFILSRLNGTYTLEELRDAFEIEFPDRKLEMEEIVRFVGQLTEAGLVLVESPGQGKVLHDRYRKFLLRKRLATWSNILYVKLPVFDPERILNRMLPFFRWAYAPPVVLATVLLWLTALTWVLVHYQHFQARLPSFEAFFNWRNIVAMWAVMAGVKVIHEFGHGLTCKYFKGECHEMGILILVLAPCLYCDVSDSWLLPNKWHRIAIAAAGIYVELTLAALATFVWWFTPDGVINTLALAVMFLCSVNTVLFNGNPLLRFDGYYMLMDYMEVPNLRRKASELFTKLFAWLCFGLPAEIEPSLPRSRRVFFVIYAIASYLYRWFIAVVILLFLYRFLRPYRLGVVSTALALASLGALIAFPLYHLGKYLRQMRKVATLSPWRVGLTLAVLALVGAAFFLVPLPYRVRAMAYVQPQEAQQVWVDVPGRLVVLAVRDGDRVRNGDLLARLSNPEKELELMKVEMNLEQHRLAAQALRLSQDPTRRAEALRAEQQAQELAITVQRLREELKLLELRARRDGVVLGAPRPEMLGAYLTEGTLFCRIGDPEQLEVRLYIDQAYIGLVEVGQTVRIKLYSQAEETFPGTITAISRVTASSIPTELSNRGGGEIPTKTDEKTGNEIPLSTLYEAVVPLANSEGKLAVQHRGVAKIHVAPTTLAWRTWRLIRRTLGFRV